MPSRYLNQCWNIVDWTLRNKLNRNSYTFSQENAFENVVWKMASILSRPQCVNRTSCIIMNGVAVRIGLMIYPTHILSFFCVLLVFCYQFSVVSCNIFTRCIPRGCWAGWKRVKYTWNSTHLNTAKMGRVLPSGPIFFMVAPLALRQPLMVINIPCQWITTK